MNYVALIPVRGGSKGLPGKNIKVLNEKPLVAWSIESALSSKNITDVYVSTDSKEIQKIAEEFGAKAPYIRPKEISGDTATTESAVMHFIDWCQSNHIVIDNIVLMQATSPIRTPGSIDKAIKLFEKEESDSLLTVVKAHKFIWKNPHAPASNYDYLNRPRRQDIKIEDREYFENGSFYITKLTTYKKFQNRLGGNISLFEMSEEESVDIDSEIDFKIAEVLMKEKGIN